MASVSTASSLRLLLRHPVGGLDGIEFETLEPALAQHLLSMGILEERLPLSAVDGRPTQLFGDRAVALSAFGDALSIALDPRRLRRFAIDVDQLCHAVRQANRLTGPPVERLSARIHLLGDREGSGPRRRVFLIRVLRADNALASVSTVRARAEGTRLAILTPTQRPLSPDCLRQVRAEGAAVIAMPQILASEPKASFRLRLPTSLLGEQPGAATARLSVDRPCQRVVLDGCDVPLARREFLVLVELARQAAGTGGIVSRERILDIIAENSAMEDDEPQEEQIDICISRIRAALAKAAGEATSRLIVTHRKAGYRLGLAAGEVFVR
jgi:DNA-binding response OmpR family regulator